MKLAKSASTPYYQNKVRKSLFTWLDILGFKALLKSSNEQELNNLVTHLMGVLEGAKQHYITTYNNDWGIEPAWECKAFSDNLIIAYPIVNTNGFEISHSIFMAAHYQMDMALSGYFIRGAMAVGDTFLNADIVISKPLLETYDDESKYAVNPRIIISNSLKQLIDKNIIDCIGKAEIRNEGLFEALCEGLLVDSDGWYFINYLEIVANVDKSTFKKRLKNHREVVRNKLIEYSNNAKIYTKYQWAANYHNYFCKSDHNNWSDCLIETEFADMSSFYQIGKTVFTDFKQLLAPGKKQ